MSKKSPKSQSNPVLGVSPDGTLLDFKADVQSDFGFAYERFLDFEKEAHAHNRFVICTARTGSEFEVKDERTGKRYLNTKELFIFKPPMINHSLRSLKTVYDNIVFLPSEKKMRETFDALGYDEKTWTQMMSGGIRSVRRSEWLDMLSERYLSRRLFSPNKPLSYLEEEIMTEALELVLGKPSSGEVSNAPTPGLGRAIELIETSLFSSLDLESVARGSGLSRSGLIRLFKVELKTSPMAYVRTRRLEEARNLIKKRGHTVTEVAYLVGYEDTSAFSRAYKAEFGHTPQSDA